MSYRVKEIFYSLQGEGVQAGRAAVFLRFAGCNLWSGREDDRARAVCRFCDTDFVGTDGPRGGVYATITELVQSVHGCWPRAARPEPGRRRLVVCTGGEPLLQLDAALIAALQAAGFAVAVESNGTLPAPAAIDWLTVSPKADAPLVQRSGDELKLVFPQEGISPHLFAGLAFDHFVLQPRDDPDGIDHTAAALAWCLEHPEWRLGLQLHKLVGIR